MDGAAGWQGTQSPGSEGTQAVRGLSILWGPSPIYNLNLAQRSSRQVWCVVVWRVVVWLFLFFPFFF